MNCSRASLFIAIVTVATCGAVVAATQPSPFVNFQGVLRDDLGAPETGSFDMTFHFFDAVTGGNEILVDAHLAAGTGAVTVTGGLFNVVLGGGAVSDGSATLPGDPYTSLAEVFRDFATVYVEVKVGAETLSPRILVLATAYALNADHLDGKDASEYLDTSSTTQTKSGDLTVDDLDTTGNVDVGGVISISDGSPATGRVLTTDAAGNADWQDPVPGPVGPPGPEGPPGLVAMPVHSVTTVDATGDVGVHSAITIGADGHPIIVYVDVSLGNLKVARCLDAACGSPSIVNTGVIGRPHDFATTTIAIGPDGFPVISHADIAVVHCHDAGCSSFTERHVSGNGFSSLAIGPDGFPKLTYAMGDMMFVTCDDSDCEVSSEIRIVSGEFTWTSLAYAPDGFPVFAFADSDMDMYYYGRCFDATCSISGSDDIYWDPTSSDEAREVSLTIGYDGLPIIAFYHAKTRDLMARHCDDLNCSSGAITTVDSTGDVGRFASIGVPPDGFPVISFYDETQGDLCMVKCGDASCSSAYRQVLDSTGNVEQYTSMAIAPDGMPVISYYDATNGDLKMVRCTNRYCIPHYTRR